MAPEVPAWVQSGSADLEELREEAGAGEEWESGKSGLRDQGKTKTRSKSAGSLELCRKSKTSEHIISNRS